MAGISPDMTLDISRQRRQAERSLRAEEFDILMPCCASAAVLASDRKMRSSLHDASKYFDDGHFLRRARLALCAP